MAKYKALIVDDDGLVRMNWRVAAEGMGKDLRVFGNPGEFLGALEGFSKETAIYLDSELGEGIRGEEIVREVYEKGFRNLYLTTGHSPETFPAMPWIKKIVGKGPPWA